MSKRHIESVSDEPGNGYFIYLKAGWCRSQGYDCHHVLGETKELAYEALKNIAPCECQRCKDKLREERYKAAEKIFWHEITAVTTELWCEEEIAEDESGCCAQIVKAVEARDLADKELLREAQDCLSRDWCSGKVKTAFLMILARAGELEVYDTVNTIYSRRPRTTVIEGVRYITG